MDEIIARIKAYSIVRNPSMKPDDFLDFVVNDVVDRTLAYTFRERLIAGYEQDLIDFPDPGDDDKEFWDVYDSYPIPVRLERMLAGIVNQSYKTIINQNTAETGAVGSLSDNGQSISFTEQLQQYYGVQTDAEVFASSLKILDKYRLAKSVTNEDTGYYARTNC